MSTADQLLELMFSWIEQRQRCAKQLKKLARELESLREKCNAGECVGSSVSVVGAAALIGAGVATFFTGGAAAPFLGLAGGVYTGVGLTVSMVTKITEHLLSSDTMKDAEKIEKKSKEIGEKIQKLFDQLKVEVKKMSSITDPDKVDQHVLAEILGAVARRSGLKQPMNFSKFLDELQIQKTCGSIRVPSFAGIVELHHILAFFTYKLSGKTFKLLFATAARELSKAGVKTAIKGGARIAGGVVGLAFELPEAISNWKELIKNSHVTEASQSLRDTADAMLETCRTLKEQFDNIEKMLKKLTDMKRYIENSNRSSEDKKKLIEFVKEMSEDEAVLQWLKEKSQSEVFFHLLDMFNFLQEELDKKKEKTDCEDIDITFVAHGSIEESLIPARCLLPLSTITDVLLYSPWNCAINADAAYGVATGHIRPQHRVFCCGEEACRTPDERHQPTNLPNRWNSMKAAGEQKIPNIFVSPLRKPEDGAWNRFEFLQNKYGQPGRNRIVIPFVLPDKIRVPFSVITFTLSLVLFLSSFKATIHLTACLSKISARTRLREDYLKAQYACTIDHTYMKSSDEMFPNRDPNLYRAFKAMFG